MRRGKIRRSGDSFTNRWPGRRISGSEPRHCGGAPRARVSEQPQYLISLQGVACGYGTGSQRMTVCPWDPPQVTCGDYPSQASYNLTTEGLNFDDLKTAFWLRPLRAPPRARRRAPERCNELPPFHSRFSMEPLKAKSYLAQKKAGSSLSRATDQCLSRCSINTSSISVAAPGGLKIIPHGAPKQALRSCADFLARSNRRTTRTLTRICVQQRDIRLWFLDS